MNSVAASDNFRANLATLMAARKLSKTDVARALNPADQSGRSRVPYVIRILNGETVPGLDQCESIARGVGMPLTAMLVSPQEFSTAVLTAAN